MQKDNIQASKLKITETVLRDAHQSLAATRMRIEDMLPVCELLDSIGYWSIECWGGATFDACLRYLNEDPWERLRVLRKAMPNTKLQMLLRGQNLLGYRHYADDVVDLFVRKSIENGIDIIRIFDALNDLRNIKTALQSAKKYGAIAEIALSYTVSPVHNTKYYIDLAIEAEKMGADVICIKDMANLLLPKEAYNLVRGIKEATSLPIHIHTHNTAGTGAMVYYSAVQAGVDIIDCAISPFSNGSSQPCTEAMVAAFKNTDRDTELDIQKLSEIADYFKGISEKMETEGLILPRSLKTDSNCLRYQIPGGMLSNLLAQLKQADASDRIDEVLNELPIVRKDFGYPPLVTPTSQIVGTQAVMNVLLGRYKTFPKESKMLLAGQYGKLLGEINLDVKKRALGDDRSITCRPADLLEPELNHIREQYADIAKTDEDLLSCAMFPQVAPGFIKKRDDLIVHEINVDWQR